MYTTYEEFKYALNKAAGFMEGCEMSLVEAQKNMEQAKQRYAELEAAFEEFMGEPVMEIVVPQTYEEKLAQAREEAAAHGPYAYGDTSNPVAKVEYEESQRKLAEQVENCRWCKGAQTRAAKKHVDNWQDAMCSEHKDRSRLNFACSPVSENYWCS